METQVGDKISVKAAVQKAVDYFRNISISELPRLQVEEVEQSEDGESWLITLGYDGQALVVDKLKVEMGFGSFQPPQVVPHPRCERVYRTFRVNRTTGEVLTMKISPTYE